MVDCVVQAMTPYFQNEWATIYCCDCRDVLPALEPVDLLLTDPPYGIASVWRGGTRGWLVWNKPERGFSLAEAELAWTNLDMPIRVWDCRRSDPDRQHPTQKPLDLMRWCLLKVPEAQTVLDPFMGSGTTMRACKDLGRKFVGIEIEEKYCEMAVKRLAQEVLSLC